MLNVTHVPEFYKETKGCGDFEKKFNFNKINDNDIPVNKVASGTAYTFNVLPAINEFDEAVNILVKGTEYEKCLQASKINDLVKATAEKAEKEIISIRNDVF